MMDTLANKTAEFTPQVIASLNRAYAQALRMLGERGYGLDTQFKVADHMLSLAKDGETDDARLCTLSLRAAFERRPSAAEAGEARHLQGPASRHGPAPGGSHASGREEPPLNEAEMVALRQACGPVGVLGFPPTEVIHTLRRSGYITIVLGGVQITPLGLERLLRERARCLATP